MQYMQVCTFVNPPNTLLIINEDFIALNISVVHVASNVNLFSCAINLVTTLCHFDNKHYSS